MLSIFKHKNNSDKRGVVLVMALIIMAMIMVSVLAFSAIISGEVKMSLNTGNVVISYYAAESGIEKGLHRIKYSRENSDFTSFTNLDNAGSNTYTINNPYIKSREYKISEATISADDYLVYDLSTSTLAHVDIIDPAGDISNINWDPYTLSYKYMVSWMIDDCFPYHASDRLEISVTSFDTNFLSPKTEKKVAICDCSFTSDDCNTDFTTFNIVDTKFYRFAFRPLTGNVDQLAFNLYRGNNSIGILSEASVDSYGTYSNSKYYIKARIPSLSPLSDVFSYVLFSEEDLTKGI